MAFPLYFWHQFVMCCGLFRVILVTEKDIPEKEEIP